MILYRPVGSKELELIKKSNYRRFPPRLAEQPIFYPVLNEQYATEIASSWNVKYNEDHRGYVTKFEVDDQYCGQFEVHQVGARTIRSYGFQPKNWMNLMSISSGKYISSANFQIDNMLSCKTGVASEAMRGLSGIGSLTRKEVQRIIGIQSE